MIFFADIDGRGDTKRIYGITAVEEKAKQEKAVKVQLHSTLPALVL